MRQINALVLMALAVSLGGCSSFLGIKLAGIRPSAAPAPLPPAIDATRSVETDAGRAHLAAGNTGFAIEAFQRALARGEAVAPAVNGLGVAYARIGRFDLAKRFFEQAMATEPLDPRYSDNLARLMRSPALAMRRDGDIAAAAIAAASPDQQTAKAPPVPGRLERISRAEVRIATVPPQTAPTRTATNDLNSRFKPLVRVSFADERVQAPKAFVRIELPEPKPEVAATGKGSEDKPDG